MNPASHSNALVENPFDDDTEGTHRRPEDRTAAGGHGRRARSMAGSLPPAPCPGALRATRFPGAGG
jgi:hypothetical protein